jgi:hypothetical protein
MALPFTTLKKYLKAKEELWKLKYGNSPCKNLIFKQILRKETKILQDIVTLELISSFNTRQNTIFEKSSYIKMDLYYYLGAKIPYATRYTLK